ncbi:MAG: hypothetical protein AB1578_04645 [Thermodesulfobacteriota bacterium]
MTGRRRSSSGSGAPAERLNLACHRYHRREVNPHVTNALLHLGLARRAARRRDRESARREYARSLTCWKKADLQDGGRWDREVRLVQREKSELPPAGSGTGGSRRGP